MKFRHLEYSVATAEELNFTHAAARLHVSQPPFSKQIHDLEAELGIHLFERQQKAVALTAAGHAFLLDARLILEAYRTSREPDPLHLNVTHIFLCQTLS